MYVSARRESEMSFAYYLLQKKCFARDILIISCRSKHRPWEASNTLAWKNKAMTHRQLQPCTLQHRCVGMLRKQDKKVHHRLYPYCTMECKFWGVYMSKIGSISKQTPIYGSITLSISVLYMPEIKCHKCLRGINRCNTGKHYVMAAYIVNVIDF